MWMRRTLLTLVLTATALCAQTPVPIIFDTDIGDDIDDALALALALQSPELDIKAITTVSDDTAKRASLVWKELGLYSRQDIPVGVGVREPLLDPLHPGTAPQFQVLTAADSIPPARQFSAVPLLIDTLIKSPVKMTLVPVGPLTNIALALRIEPKIKNKIERIVLMGGAFSPARAEYNILRDRVASAIVFGSGVPVVAVGLDVTTKCKLQGADFDRLRAATNPASQFLVRLITLWQNGKPQQYPTLHDPLAIAAVFGQGLLKYDTGRVTVETADPKHYGLTTFTPGRDGATRVATEVDSAAFLKLFTDRLASPPRSR